MASFLNKIKMKSAKNPRDFKDFSHSHLTTQNFNQIMPITNTELIPDSHIECNPSTFLRFEPLVQPTFMDVKIKNRAFFVPYVNVWRPFNSFITRSPYQNSSTTIYPTEVPTISDKIICDYFMRNSQDAPSELNLTDYYTDEEILSTDSDLGQRINQNDSETKFDLFFPNGKASGAGYYGVGLRLSSKGRFAYKVLCSLGYQFDTAQYQVGNDVTKQIKHSALPLLCYAKIFLDWYYPSQYAMFTSIYNDVDKILKRENVYSLNGGDLWSIMELIMSYFADDNYFVNSFDYPTMQDGIAADTLMVEGLQSPVAPGQVPNIQLNTQFNPLDSSDAEIKYTSTTGQYGESVQDDNITDMTSGNMKITNWAIAAVSRLSSWLKRNQLAGAKVVDRFLARYGVQLPSEKSQRCYYIGEQSFDAIFSDVISTSETEESSLGDFAGKGVAYDNNGHFEFDTNEFGQFIVTNVVTPRVSYVQGYDRQLDHISTFDFYQPEYDGLGFVAVKKGELISPSTPDDYGYTYQLYNHENGQTVNLSPSNYTSATFSDADADLETFDKKVFGFMPRYVEMKVPRDRITGNFKLGRVTGSQSWTNARYFQRFKFDVGADLSTYLDIVADYDNALRHSPDFMEDDGRQYNRIFYSDNNTQDYINVRHIFRMSISAPILPLYDQYNFDDEKHKQDVTIGSQGSKLS